jgi:hypothetical protein
LCFWIGLYPAPFLKAMEASVTNVIQTVEKGAAGKAFGAKQATPPSAGQPGNPATGKSGTSEPQVARLPNRQIAKPDDSRLADLVSRKER